MLIKLLLVFFGGYFMGMLAEYILHWMMHRWKWRNHFEHHKEYWKLDPYEVAKNAVCLPMDIRWAICVLIALSPLSLFWGWLAVLVFFIGVFVHLVIVYESVHFIFHYEKRVPGFIRRRKWFKYWRDCHLAHHVHAPRGNYSVTFAWLLDRILGTYVPPRSAYGDPRKRSQRSTDITE